MIDRCLQTSLLLFPAVLIVMGNALKAKAKPIDIFAPHLDRISHTLAPNLLMRLPESVPLSASNIAAENPDAIQVLPSADRLGLVINLHRCSSRAKSCLLGRFSGTAKDSLLAQNLLEQHQNAQTPIALPDGIAGYLWSKPGKNLSAPLTSLMWQQDGQFYTVEFQVQDPQILVEIAASMVRSAPIQSTAVSAIKTSAAENSMLEVSSNPTVNRERLERSDAARVDLGQAKENPDFAIINLVQFEGNVEGNSDFAIIDLEQVGESLDRDIEDNVGKDVDKDVDKDIEDSVDESIEDNDIEDNDSMLMFSQLARSQGEVASTAVAIDRVQLQLSPAMTDLIEQFNADETAFKLDLNAVKKSSLPGIELSSTASLETPLSALDPAADSLRQEKFNRTEASSVTQPEADQATNPSLPSLSAALLQLGEAGQRPPPTDLAPLIFPIALDDPKRAVTKIHVLPAERLAPPRQQIQKRLPKGWVMRLPDPVLLNADPDVAVNQYRFQLVPANDAPGLAVDLLSCDRNLPSCQIGRFAVTPQDDAASQTALQQHQDAAAPIALAPGIQGHFLDGSQQDPPRAVSSVMWQQDNLVYTVRFPVPERQNLLYMAASMAQSQPIRSAADPPVAAELGPQPNALSAVLVLPGTLFPDQQKAIQQRLPAGWVMRLPETIVLQDPPTMDRSQYRVRISPARDRTGLAIELLACEDNPQMCLVGSFSVRDREVAAVKAALQRHQDAAAPITLARDIQGYFLDGQRQDPPSPFSSIMWPQDDRLYTVRFRTQQRQNILFMASSMANQRPIFSAADIAAGRVQKFQAPPKSPRLFDLPVDLFAAHQQEIEAKLNEGLSLRLPEQVSLLDPPSTDVSQYRIRVFPAANGSPFQVKLLSCDDKPDACQVGSFAVAAGDAAVVQAQFQQHQQASAPITLADNVQGYFQDGRRQEPARPFSSVMWLQDNQFYTVRFRNLERQNILYMAASMVVRDPILGTAEPIVTPASPGGREQGTGNGEQGTGEDLGARPSAAMPASTLPNLEGTENREQGIGESTDRLPSSTTPTGLPPDSTLTSPSETVDVGATTPAEPPFLLSKIDIVDSTVLVKEEVEKILQSSSESGEPEETEGSEEKSQFTGIKVTERPGENNRTIWSIEFDERETTVEELQSIADAVTQFYLTQDHVTSRAIPVDISGKTARILAIEGDIKNVIVCPNPEDKGENCSSDGKRKLRLDRSYIESRIRLGVDPPLMTARLERNLRLLETEPSIKNVEANLKPTGERGKTDLVVTVTENPAFFLSVTSDNYSPPSVGSERLGLHLGYRNLIFSGDVLTGSWFRSIAGGLDSLDFNYQMTLNPMNGTLRFRVAPNRNEIIQSEFRDLNIRGNTERYEISYRQPLFRSPRHEFALSAGFTVQKGQTFIFDQIPAPFGIGPDDEGRSRTSVFHFAQEYIRRELQGTWFVRSQFNFGTNLFNATTNDDPTPDGQFLSWFGQIQRAQRLGKGNILLLSGDLQLTPNTLLPAQQFVIGGGPSVRGFRQNARAGDNGFRFSIEDRIAVVSDAAGQPALQLAPFIDVGAIWNTTGNPNVLPRQRFLLGVGLGVLWDRAFGIDDLKFRLDYALPLVDLDDRGSNLQDNGFFFQLQYNP